MNLLVILGATCSGKSKMAIEIAQKYINLGQKVVIVNCDSRQIYQNLNIGTAKIPGIWQKLNLETEISVENYEKLDKKLPKIESNYQKSTIQIGIKNQTKISETNINLEGKNRELNLKLTKNKFQNPNLCNNNSTKKFINIHQDLVEKQGKNAFFWKNIPHFLIDFVPVNYDYNLVNFVQDWCNLVAFWQQNNTFDLVILVGGSGLWAKAIVENYNLGTIKMEYLKIWQKNKTQLQNLILGELQQKYLTKLSKINKKKADNLETNNSKNLSENQNFGKNRQISYILEIKSQTQLENNLENESKKNKNIELARQNNHLSQKNTQNSPKNMIPITNELNNSDFQNPIRLVNWLLRYKTLEKNWSQKINYPKFVKTQIIAIKVEKNKLNQKIKKSVQDRIKQGLLAEVKEIVASFERQKIWNLGLEYRESLRLLDGKIDSQAWENNLITQNQQYAKRQITWLNKEKLQENLLWMKDLSELEKILDDLEF